MRAVVFLLAIGACSDKKTEIAAPPANSVAEAKPEPPPKPPSVFPVDKLAKAAPDANVDQTLADLRRVIRELAPELVITQVQALYVRKDGTLHPTYGSLLVETSLSNTPDGIVDDPDRPTGAPVPEAKVVEQSRTSCPWLALEKGVWTASERFCKRSKAMSMRCTMVDVWKQSLAEGAPADAIATITRTDGLSFWTLQITDKVRNVNFSKYVEDNCEPPKQKTPKPNPDGAR